MRLISAALAILIAASSAVAQPAQARPELMQPFDCRDAIWPVAAASFLSRFGDGNTGIEIRVLENSQVKAVESGTVIFASNKLSSLGNVIMIRHNGKVVSIYSRLSELHVKQGQHVDKGQTVGLSGATGIVSGPQLFFELRFENKPIDPRRCLPKQLPELALLDDE